MAGCSLVLLLLAVLVLIVFILGLCRVNVLRQVTQEGIEDEPVAQAYDRVNRWPQFKALRRLIANELKSHHTQGILADIGCGLGYLVDNMAKSFPQLFIFGVDIASGKLHGG